MVFQAAVDFLHMFATVGWIAGVIHINMMITPVPSTLAPGVTGNVMDHAVRRFAVVSWSSVIVLLVTGFQKTPAGMLFNMSGSGGVTLPFKHAVLLVIVSISLLLSFIIVPRMASLASKQQKTLTPEYFKIQKQLRSLATGNMVLGVVVLFCVVLLLL